MELHTGITGIDEIEVTQANTAEAVGSGTLPVFATPAMLASMEKAAYTSVQSYLDEGCGTVGILLNAVLPGNDYVFGKSEQGDQAVNFKV